MVLHLSDIAGDSPGGNAGPPGLRPAVSAPGIVPAVATDGFGSADQEVHHHD
jgi:hypothetical protein